MARATSQDFLLFVVCKRRRNTASHDDHEKSNSWVPYKYGAPHGVPSGNPTSTIVLKVSLENRLRI